MADNDALLLKVPDAARLLNISHDHCYELIARSELPAIRLGRAIFVPRLGLEQWIARQAGLPAGPPEAVDFAQQPAQRH